MRQLVQAVCAAAMLITVHASSAGAQRYVHQFFGCYLDIACHWATLEYSKVSPWGETDGTYAWLYLTMRFETYGGLIGGVRSQSAGPFWPHGIEDGFDPWYVSSGTGSGASPWEGCALDWCNFRHSFFAQLDDDGPRHMVVGFHTWDPNNIPDSEEYYVYALPRVHSYVVTPEPSTVALLSGGLVALGGVGVRQRRRKRLH